MTPDEANDAGDDLVIFRRCADDVEADGLLTLLRSHGIHGFVQGQHHRMLLGPFGPAIIAANVLVARSQVERATSIAQARVVEDDLPGPLQVVPAPADDDGDDVAPPASRAAVRLIGYGAALAAAVLCLSLALYVVVSLNRL